MHVIHWSFALCLSGTFHRRHEMKLVLFSHSGHWLTVPYGILFPSEKKMERNIVVFYNHPVPHGSGHTWTQLSGRWIPHYRSCNWHSRWPKSISYPMFALHHRPAVLPKPATALRLWWEKEPFHLFISSWPCSSAQIYGSDFQNNRDCMKDEEAQGHNGTKYEIATLSKKQGFHNKPGFH